VCKAHGEAVLALWVTRSDPARVFARGRVNDSRTESKSNGPRMGGRIGLLVHGSRHYSGRKLAVKTVTPPQFAKLVAKDRPITRFSLEN
jgi:hypothetical protein